jgi:hypothetical protein
MIGCLKIGLILGAGALAALIAAPGRAHAAVACGTPNAAGAAACFIDPKLDPKALCNDGTLPMFWIRPGSGVGASRWIIWLQGGGHCTDQPSCAQRAATPGTASLITSNGFAATAGIGVISSSASENPVMYNANTVNIHYCSSDDWTGAYSSTSAFNPNDPTTWNFQGRRIALAAINSLRELEPSFAFAAFIVFGGTSAGGEGATLVANDVLPLLPPAPTILLANDAGFANDIGQFDASAPSPYIYAGEPNAFFTNFQNAINLWHGRGDAKCAATAGTLQQQINCYNSALVLQQGYITLPSFVAESQIDSAQVSDEICPSLYGDCAVPHNPASQQGVYTTAFGQAMASQLTGAGTKAAYWVTSPDAYMHVILQDDAQFIAAYTTATGSVTPRDQWDAWLNDPRGPRTLSLGTGPGVH